MTPWQRRNVIGTIWGLLALNAVVGTVVALAIISGKEYPWWFLYVAMAIGMVAAIIAKRIALSAYDSRHDGGPPPSS